MFVLPTGHVVHVYNLWPGHVYEWRVYERCCKSVVTDAIRGCVARRDVHIVEYHMSAHTEILCHRAASFCILLMTFHARIHRHIPCTPKRTDTYTHTDTYTYTDRHTRAKTHTCTHSTMRYTRTHTCMHVSLSLSPPPPPPPSLSPPPPPPSPQHTIVYLYAPSVRALDRIVATIARAARLDSHYICSLLLFL